VRPVHDNAKIFPRRETGNWNEEFLLSLKKGNHSLSNVSTTYRIGVSNTGNGSILSSRVLKTEINRTNRHSRDRIRIQYIHRFVYQSFSDRWSMYLTNLIRIRKTGYKVGSCEITFPVISITRDSLRKFFLFGQHKSDGSEAWLREH